MKRSRSIRTQLMVLVAAVALPLGAMEAYSMYATFRTELRHAEREALYLAEGIAANIQQYLRDGEEVAANLASWMGAGGFPRTCGTAINVAYQVITHFEDLVVVDRDGFVQCLGSGATGPGTKDMARQEWFHRAVAFDNPVLTGLHRDPLTGEWTAAMGFPLRDETGTLIGAVGGLVSPDHFLRLLAPVTLPDAAVVTVVDSRRTVVARTSEHARWVGTAVPDLEETETSVGPGRTLSRGPGLDGVDRTWGTVTLPGNRWQISAGLPREAIVRPLVASAVQRALVAATLVLMVALLAFSLYRRIATSLHALVHRTRQSPRQEAAPLPADGPSEVIEVGAQFERALAARFRAEDAEREAKERYRSILENAIFGIYVSTRDGRFLEVNPALARMLGYESPEALKAVPLASLYADPEQRARLVAEHREGRVIDHVEVDWRRADGAVITVRLSGNSVRAGQADGAGFEVIVEDITDQLALEEQYRQTQKMDAVGRLAGGVAHDFNNLLTVMIGQTRLLMCELPEGAPAWESAQEVVEAGERAAGLTRRLLAFSRKEVARNGHVDLNGLVEDLEKMLVRLIGADIELETRLDPTVHGVLGDPGQLEQVVMNLVVNARDAMPNGGRIVIESANVTLTGSEAASHPGLAPGGYVLLRVSDTGTGIPPELQSRVFEPFFTTKPKGLGTGLGLSTVYGIVTQSGGGVTLKSRPDEGTTFDILLPRFEGVVAGSDPESDREAPAEGVETLLVVEDEAPVRSVVTRVLERAGYRVLPVENGEEALRVARTHDGPIHLTVTDIVMPGMKGTALAERLARLRPESRILFISGYSDTPDIDAWTQADPGILLAKPFTPRALQERVFERIHGQAPSAVPAEAG